MDNNYLKSDDFIRDASLPITVIRRDPQPPYPLHTHEFSELVIVYEGSGIQFNEYQEKQLEAGHVFVLHGNMKHGYRNLKGLKLVNIIFDLEFIGSPLAELHSFPSFNALFSLEPEYETAAADLKLSTSQLDKVMNYVTEIEEEIRSKHAGYRMMITAQFMQLIAYLSRCYEKAPPDKAEAIMRLGRVLSYIERNYATPIKLKELAKIGRMSESGVTRAFRKYTGKTPVEYVISIRIQRASILLNKFPDRSISEIAFETGFSDSNYFSRLFKKSTGKSPREFRGNRALESYNSSRQL